MKDANDLKEESREKETTRLELMLKKNLELLLNTIGEDDQGGVNNCFDVVIADYDNLAKAYEVIEEKVPQQTRDNFYSIFQIWT